jgi:nitrate reductase beta subunit
MQYLAGLFAGGNEEEVRAVYRKLIAVRIQRRQQSVGDLADREVAKACDMAGVSAEEIAAIFRMTTLTGIKERIVIPPMLREQAIEAGLDPQEHREEMGFGSRRPPRRRW